MEGKLIKQLTDNKFVLKNIVQANPNGETFFTATGLNPLNTLLYKVDLKGKQTLLTSDQGTHNVSISEDGKYILDQFSTHNIQGKTVLLNHKGKQLQEIVISEDKYKDVQLGTTEIGELKGKDGTKLYTRTIKPNNFDPSKKYPVLVYVYGRHSCTNDYKFIPKRSKSMDALDG